MCYKKYSTLRKFTCQITKAFGMYFFRLATLDDEYSVSVRMVHSTRPTPKEKAYAVKRLVEELKQNGI